MSTSNDMYVPLGSTLNLFISNCVLCSYRIYERVIDPPETNLPPGSNLWLGQRNQKHGLFKVSTTFYFLQHAILCAWCECTHLSQQFYDVGILRLETSVTCSRSHASLYCQLWMIQNVNNPQTVSYCSTSGRVKVIFKFLFILRIFINSVFG